MTDQHPYTPSVKEVRNVWIETRHESDSVWGRIDTTDKERAAEFDRMIEAVRAEERERCAQIADQIDPAEAALAGQYAGKDIAARIREM